MTNHGMTSLILSLGALAFVTWMSLAHPARQSLFGPAPNPAAMAASVNPQA